MGFPHCFTLLTLVLGKAFVIDAQNSSVAQTWSNSSSSTGSSSFATSSYPRSLSSSSISASFASSSSFITSLSSTTWSSSVVSQSSTDPSRSLTTSPATTPTSSRTTSFTSNITSHGNTTSRTNNITTFTFPDYYNQWTDSYGAKAHVSAVLCTGSLPSKMTYPQQTITQILRASWSYSFLLNPTGGIISAYSTAVPEHTTTYTKEQVPGFNDYGYFLEEANKDCCGSCEVYFPLIDVFYWPVPGVNTSCLAQTGNSNSTNVARHPHRVRPRSITPRAGQSTVVSDGFTYTSPSVYLAYHDISASNFCGQVGSKHTSVTLALNPEDVSSVEGFDYHDHHVSTNRFNFADLPCPPPAVLAKYTSDWANANLPFNPTFYAPYIDPPSALLQLDPAWKTCDYHSLMQFDPPRALTPEAAQKPAMEQKPAITTPAGQVVTPTPATPSPQPQALPIQTPSSSTGAKDPGVKDSGAKDSDAKDPNAQGSASQDPGAKNSGINDSGAKDPNAQGSASQDPGAKDSGAKDSGAKDPNAQSSASQDPGANNSGTKDSGVQNPAGTADPGKSQTQQGQQDDQGQGKGQPGQQGQAAQQGQQNQQDQPSQQGQQGQQNTSGQQGNQGSQDKSGQQQNPAQSASGGASPSNLVYNQPAIVIQSETLQANGPAVTISDQRFVYSAGSLYVGTSPGVVINPTPAIQVQQSQDQAGPSSQQGIQAQPGNQDQQQNYNPVVIAGQTIQIIPVQSPTLPLNQGISPTYLTAFAGQPVSSNSYGVMVGSQPITAGAPRVVFSGSSISLNTNGLLVVGSTQTFAVGPSPSPSLAALAIVGGQPVIQNNAGNVVVAGSQLTPGGPTVTISGTPVFINSQSGLVIGSQTVTRIQAATPLSPPTTLAAAGGVPIVRLGPSDIQLGSSRLIPGGSTVTVSGTPVYLDSSTNLVIGSRTVAAAASSTTSPPMTLATVGGQPIVIHNPSNIEVGGTQLDAGGSTITVNGTPVHLDSSTKLVVGSQIITFAVVATQTSAGTDGNGLGGVILSGLGGIGPQQTSSTLATATSTGNGSFNFQTYRGIANRNTGDATFFAILGVLTVAVLALT